MQLRPLLMVGSRDQVSLIVPYLLASVALAIIMLAGCGDNSGSSSQTARSTRSSTPRASTPPAEPGPMHFTDVTATAGIRFQHEAGAAGKKWYPETMGSGAGFIDYDGDGWLDIVLVNGRRWPGERVEPEPTMQLYHNQGDGTFRDVTQASGLNVPHYGMGMTTADYDNDGDQDLVITGYRRTLVFRNEGNGTFSEVASASGIAQGGWSTAAAFVDVDRDGWLDLVIGDYVDWEPHKEEGLDCTYGTPQKDYCAVKFFAGLGLRLYRNLGNGRFQDITHAAGLHAPQARVLGIAVTDYNRDGWPDLVVANDLTPSLLFANQGNGTFREIAVQSGLVLDEGGVAFAGMGIDTAYLSNPHQLCVAIGNFAGQPTTVHCQAQDGDTYRYDVFLEQSHRVGVAKPTLRMVTFGLFFADLDLDGWQDLFMVNGHVVHEAHLRNVPYAQQPQLFRNRGDGTLEEVTPAPGSGLDMQLVGRGAAYGDYDNDGDLDLLLTANQGTAYLLRNDTPRAGGFLRVVTRGARSNHDGLGAQLSLYTTRQLMRGMVRSGSSYLSQSEPAVTFGLSRDERVERLEIAWPSGASEVFRSLPLNTTFVAHEGTASESLSVAQQRVTPAATQSYLGAKHTAVAHYQAGRSEAALQAFEQVLQHAPTDYIAQQYLVELYWRRGMRDKAQAQLLAMSGLVPDANFLMQFAFQLEDLGLYDLADHVYREASRRDPQAPEAPYRLGKNALRAGRYADAATAFRQALGLQPGLVDARHGLALVLIEQGKLEQAEQTLQEVLALAPNHAEAHVHLGSVYLRTRRFEQALSAYQTVVKLRPQAAQSYHNVGTVYAAQGKSFEAEQQFQEALRHDARYVPAHNDLGTLYAERGDMTQAIAAFHTAVHIDATSVKAHYNLALAFGARGESPAMMHHLRETLRLDPRHTEARLNLGIVYIQQGQVNLAIEQLRAATNLAPGMAEAHYVLAVAYAQAGQPEAMLAPLQEATRLDPQHARAHAALASLYYQRQEYELAWQYATKAAQLGAPVAPLVEALRQVRERAR